MAISEGCNFGASAAPHGDRRSLSPTGASLIARLDQVPAALGCMAGKKKNEPPQESEPSDRGYKADAHNGYRPTVNDPGRHIVAGRHLIEEIAVWRFHQHVRYHRSEPFKRLSESDSPSITCCVYD
jgi:hypothetical protein